MQTIYRWVAAGLMCVVCGCASRPYTEESVIKAQQTAAAQHTAARNTPSSFVPPAETISTNGTRQDYGGLNLDRSVAKLLDGGKVVVLDDGSTWQISPVYQSKTLLWLVAQKVVVSTGANPQYPYQIVNLTTKDVVQARFGGGTGPR